MSKKDKWVRELSREYGIDDERVDYDAESGYITLDGKKTVKPDYIKDGKSYVTDTAKLEKIFSDGQRVAVADYAASKAVPLKLSYDDGDGVTVGGKKLEGANYSGGKAYATKSAVDALTNGKTHMSIAEEGDDRYGREIEKILKELSDKRFSYNPESDEAYLAYKKEFEEAAQRAAEDTMAKYSESTGGLPNSMAVSAASGAAAEYGGRLAEKIPELYAAAFERYMEESQQSVDTAEALRRALAEYTDGMESALTADNAEIRKNNDYVRERYEAAESRRRDEETAKQALAKEEREQSLAERKFDYQKISDNEKLTDTRKKELRSAVSEAYNFIQKAFVSEETGINANGIRLYVESLEDILPKDIRTAILRTYNINE